MRRWLVRTIFDCHARGFASSKVARNSSTPRAALVVRRSSIRSLATAAVVVFGGRPWRLVLVAPGGGEGGGGSTHATLESSSFTFVSTMVHFPSAIPIGDASLDLSFTPELAMTLGGLSKATEVFDSSAPCICLLGNLNALVESRLRKWMPQESLICRVQEVLTRKWDQSVKQAAASSPTETLLRSTELASRLTPPSVWAHLLVRGKPRSVMETVVNFEADLFQKEKAAPAFLLASAACALYRKSANIHTVLYASPNYLPHGSPIVLETGEVFTPDKCSAASPTVFIGNDGALTNLRDLIIWSSGAMKAHGFLMQSVLARDCATPMSIERLLSRSAWHKSDETLSGLTRTVTAIPAKMIPPRVTAAAAPPAATTTVVNTVEHVDAFHEADASVVVLSLMVYYGDKRCSLTGARVFPPANSAIYRDPLGRSVTRDFSSEAQWIPREVSALAEINMSFTSYAEVVTWCRGPFRQLLKNVALVRRADRTSAHTHKFLLVLTAESDVFDSLAQLVALAATDEQTGSLLAELTAPHFSFGWTRDGIFWPQAVGTGRANTFCDNWQRAFVGSVTALALKTSLMRFHAENPKPREGTSPLERQFMSLTQRTGERELGEYTNKMWSSLSSTLEDMTRGDLLDSFCICTFNKAGPAAGRRLHYFSGASEVKTAMTLRDTKVIVMLDARACLTDMGVDDELRDFLSAGKSAVVWCMTYAHHLMSGFPTHQAAKVTLQQLTNLYGKAASICGKDPMVNRSENTSSNVAELAAVFIGQVTIACKTMRQLRILRNRMPMVLAAYCMEQCGLKLIPKAERESKMAEKVRQRDLLSNQIVALVPPLMRQKWNPRATVEVGAMLLGGLLPKLLIRAMPAALEKEQLPRTDLPARLMAAGPLLAPLAENMSVVVLTATMSSVFVAELSVYFVDADVELVLPIVKEGPLTAGVHTLHSAVEAVRRHKCAADIRSALLAAPGPPKRRDVVIVVDQGALQQTVMQTIGLIPAIVSDQWTSSVTVVNGAALVSSVPGGTSFLDDFSDMMSKPLEAERGRGRWERIVAGFAGTEGLLDGAQVQMARKSLFCKLLGESAVKCSLNVMTDGAAAKNPFVTYIDPTAPAELERVPQFANELVGLMTHFTDEEQRAVLQRAYRNNSLSVDNSVLDFIAELACKRPKTTQNEIDGDALLVETISALKTHRSLEKQLSSDHLSRSDSNDLVHSFIDVFGTATGRITSMRPNIHNIPSDKAIRECFVSRFGLEKGLLVELDYSQLEVSILAVLSRDKRMLEAIGNSIDFHTVRVSLMTREPYEEVLAKVKAKDPVYIELRQKAKIFSFQRQYGAGVRTIAENSGMSVEEITALIESEEREFQGVAAFVQLVTSAVSRMRPLVLNKRKEDLSVQPQLSSLAAVIEPRQYFQLPTGTKFSFTEAYGPQVRNYPVQGFAAEVVQIVVGRVNQLLLSTRNMNGKAFLINTVHDSIWLDLHRDVAAQVVTSVKEVMEKAPAMMRELFPEMPFDVPLPVAVKAGSTLGNMSDVASDAIRDL